MSQSTASRERSTNSFSGRTGRAAGCRFIKRSPKKKIVLPLFPPLLQVRVRGQAASVAETLMTGKFHQFSLHSSLIPLKNHVVYLQICTFLPFLSHLTLECVHCQGSICGLFLSFRLPLSSITDPEAEVQKMRSKTLDFKDDLSHGDVTCHFDRYFKSIYLGLFQYNWESCFLNNLKRQYSK